MKEIRKKNTFNVEILLSKPGFELIKGQNVIEQCKSLRKSVLNDFYFRSFDKTSLASEFIVNNRPL